MKTKSSRSGFTLIEMLTTITIVSILAAMAWGGATLVQRKSKEKKSYHMIQQLVGKLTDYRADNGYYPEPASNESVVEIGGAAWSSGGAACLYQAMTGDGNNEIKGITDPISSTGEPGKDGAQVFMDNIQPPSEKDIREKKVSEWVAVEGQNYFLIDAFRHPFTYTLAIKDVNKQVVNKDDLYSNGDYDLFSYGQLTKAENTEDAQLKWVTSWGPIP